MKTAATNPLIQILLRQAKLGEFQQGMAFAVVSQGIQLSDEMTFLAIALNQGVDPLFGALARASLVGHRSLRHYSRLRRGGLCFFL